MFEKHVESIVTAASKHLGFIIRNSRAFTNLAALKSPYYAFVRSKLKYASVVFCPTFNYQMQALGKEQSKFFKTLFSKSEGGYDHNRVLLKFDLSHLNAVVLLCLFLVLSFECYGKFTNYYYSF